MTLYQHFVRFHFQVGLKASEEENRLLRKLLADKELELEIQRELLKKKFGTSDPRKI